ncbi:MAG TPA: hypothetical protein VMZ27_00750, partial [Candidatus Saccharimonadales bacterium]|nr:hypothetical protein [Candidatus Saccharimonadales bacterium]
MNQPPGNPGLKDSRLDDPIFGAAEEIMLQHDEVSQFPGFQGAHLLVATQQQGVVHGVEAN